MLHRIANRIIYSLLYISRVCQAYLGKGFFIFNDKQTIRCKVHFMNASSEKICLCKMILEIGHKSQILLQSR